MKDRWEIILSGVGGQGLIMSGSILGEAAVIFEEKNATLTSSYGVETRGTFTKSDVIISEEDIYFPEVIYPDVVLVLAPIAYDKYVFSMEENAVLIYDSSLISDLKDSKAKQYGYPITNIAREFGNTSVANVIALGIIVKKTGVIASENVIKAIEVRFSDKPQVVNLNIEAFKKGLEIA